MLNVHLDGGGNSLGRAETRPGPWVGLRRRAGGLGLRARLDGTDGPTAAFALRDGLQDVDLDHDLGADHSHAHSVHDALLSLASSFLKSKKFRAKLGSLAFRGGDELSLRRISTEVAYLIVHSYAQQPRDSSSARAVSLVRLVRRDLRGRCSHRRHGRLPRVLLGGDGPQSPR